MKDLDIAFDEPGDGLLRVRVRGLRDLDQTIGYWEAILARVADRRPRGLLVVDELTGEDLSASEWKLLVEKMAGRGLEGIRIAHAKAFDFDQIHYCETYANEAGLASRTFRSEEEALAWLREPAAG